MRNSSSANVDDRFFNYFELPKHAYYGKSEPFCIFRNRVNYFQTNASGSDQKHMKNVAEKQALLFQNVLSDQHIPTDLVRSYVFSDMLAENNHKKLVAAREDTLLHLEHRNRPYLIHTAGKNLDQILLRDLHHCYPNNLFEQPSFSFNCGSSVRQLMHGGNGNFGIDSNVLMRTSLDVQYLQTQNLFDTLANETTRRTNSREVPCILLEPKQKWILPEEIVDMSHSAAGWNHAVAIGPTGQVYQWQPIRGFHTASAGCVFSKDFPVSRNIQIQCSLHPQICHIVYGKCVLELDLRQKNHAAVVVTHSHNVQCFTHHPTRNEELVFSANRTVQWVDGRYARVPVARCQLYHTYDRLQYIDHSSSGLNTAVDHSSSSSSGYETLVGAAHKFPQIMTHLIYRNCLREENARHEHSLLHWACPFGLQQAMQMSTDAFSMIRGDDGASDQLSGLLLAPMRHIADGKREAGTVDTDLHRAGGSRTPSPHSSKMSSNSSNESDSETESKSASRKTATTESSTTKSQRDGVDSKLLRLNPVGAPNFNALLVHQTRVGDVFAQQLLLGDRVVWHHNNITTTLRNRKGAASRRKTGGVDSGSSLSDSGASSSSESDVYFSPKKRNTVKKEAASKRGKPQSKKSSGDEADGEGDEALLSSIQLNLPCGSRCDRSKSQRLFDVAGSNLLLTSQHTMISSTHDFHDERDPHGWFPLSSGRFSKVVPEDALCGFDVFKMKPSDFRADAYKEGRKDRALKQEFSSRFDSTDDLLAHHISDLMSLLKSDFLTLYEISEFVYRKVRQRVLPIQLRDFLMMEREIVEEVVEFLGPTEDSVMAVAEHSDAIIGMAREVWQDNNIRDHVSADQLLVREVRIGTEFEADVRARLQQQQQQHSGTITAKQLVNKLSPSERLQVFCHSCLLSPSYAVITSDLTLCNDPSCLAPHQLRYSYYRRRDYSAAVKELAMQNRAHAGTAAAAAAESSSDPYALSQQLTMLSQLTQSTIGGTPHARRKRTKTEATLDLIGVLQQSWGTALNDPQELKPNWPSIK